MNAKVLLMSLLVVLASCTHPLEIVGEGDILSASGEHDCLLEQLPCKAVVTGEYSETYSAVARPGYTFVGWEGCSVTTGDCSFSVSEAVVLQNWFTTTPPLIAKFAPNCNSAAADSYASIQQVIFNGKGCSSGGCHSGNRPTGNMNLSSGSSYGNIVGVSSASSALKRIQPGEATNSYLYRKVSAKTNPGSFVISGSPMPLSGAALSQAQLTALALWIDAGAPQFGRASELNEIEVLLGQCN